MVMPLTAPPFAFTSRDKKLLFLAFAAVVITKMAVVLHYGPLALGDNLDFRESADSFLDGSAFRDQAGLNQMAFPPTIWRSLGYSLTVMAAKMVAGPSWPLALSAFQATLSLGVGLLVLRLCLLAGLGTTWSVVAFLLHQWSAPLSTDPLIMEDALTGVLGAVPLLLMLEALVRGRVPGPGLFLLAGVFAALSFMIREVFQFVLPVLGVVLLVVLWRVRGPKSALLSVAALVAPLVLTVAAVQEWNYHRIGHRVTSTTGQAAYAYAYLLAAKHDPSLLEGDGPVLAALRQANRTFDYQDSRAANQMLFTEYGMNTLEQARAASRLFWHGLATRPLPFIKGALERLRLVQQGTLFAGPVTRIDDLDWWAGGAEASGFTTGWRADMERFLATRDLRELTPAAAIHMAIRAVTRVVGCLLLAIFVLGTPLLWLRLRHRLGGVAHATLAAWAMYALWVCLYIPVSFEMRYTTPVIGGAIFALLAVLMHGRALLNHTAAKGP